MGTNRTEGDLQINIIANHLGMFYVFGKTIDYLGGEYGNAILSKYPIISTQNIDISPGITSERRGLLRATIDIGFRTLKFYSTQFGIMDEEQEYHSKRLGSVFKRLMDNEPIIFCGDLNAEPYSVQLTPLMNQLMDLGTRFRNVTNTYPTPLMSRRIDYILINNQVEPFYYSVPVDTLSTVASNLVDLYFDFLPERFFIFCDFYLQDPVRKLGADLFLIYSVTETERPLEASVSAFLPPTI